MSGPVSPAPPTQQFAYDAQGYLVNNPDYDPKSIVTPANPIYDPRGIEVLQPGQTMLPGRLYTQNQSGAGGAFEVNRGGDLIFSSGTGIPVRGSAGGSAATIAAQVAGVGGRLDPGVAAISGYGSGNNQTGYDRSTPPMVQPAPSYYSNMAAINTPSNVMQPIGTQLLQRPDYIVPSQLGDVNTQKLIYGGYTPMQALNTQLQLAYKTPTLADDRFYTNELSKAVQNNIAISSEYHYVAKSTGLPQAPNPYEYVGDLSLALQKGTLGKDSVGMFDVGAIKSSLPYGGAGVQDVQWANAIRNDRGLQGTYQPDWSAAIGVIESAKSSGATGPYGMLKSFSSEYGVLSVPVQQGIAIQAANARGEPYTIAPVANEANALGYGVATVKDRVLENPSLPSGVYFTGGVSKVSSGGTPPSFLDTVIGSYGGLITPSKDISSTISGGNQTISDLGVYLGNATVDRYNLTQVNEYNNLVGVYNNMSRQNPIITTEYGKLVSPDQTFFENAGSFIKQVISALPQSKTVTADVMGQTISYESSPTAVLGYTGIGELGATEKLAIAGGSALLAAGLIGKSGGYDLSSSPVVQKATELYENNPVRNLPGGFNLPKISDVIPSAVYNAPGAGYQQIVNAPGAGLNIIANAPGAGYEGVMKTGQMAQQIVLQVPKPVFEQIPELNLNNQFAGLQVDKYGFVVNPILDTGRQLYDLSATTSAQALAQTTRQTQTYAEKLSNVYFNAQESRNANVNANANALANPSAVDLALIGGTALITDRALTTLQITPPRTETAQQFATPQVPQYPTSTPPDFGIGTPTGGQPPKPKPDYKIELPFLPSFPGTGGTTGFGGKRRRNFLEVFRMGLDVSGPILTPPSGLRPLKLRASGVPGGKQKVKITRRKKK